MTNYVSMMMRSKVEDESHSFVLLGYGQLHHARSASVYGFTGTRPGTHCVRPFGPPNMIKLSHFRGPSLQCFSYRAPQSWTVLPVELRTSPSQLFSRRSLQTYFFKLSSSLDVEVPCCTSSFCVLALFFVAVHFGLLLYQNVVSVLVVVVVL